MSSPATTSVWSQLLTHTDGHNKWYFISVEPAITDPGYVVMTAWGPIGSCHAIDVGFGSMSLEEARSLASTKAWEKERKGYKQTGTMPTFSLIAQSDTKRLVGLMKRLASHPISGPQAIRFLRTLFSTLTDEERALVAPADLLPLFRSDSFEIRKTAIGILSDLKLPRSSP